MEGGLGIFGAYRDDAPWNNSGSVYFYSVGDNDRDCAPRGWDPCPDHHDPDHADTDLDGIPDACDNCPDDSNPTQFDTDFGSVFTEDFESPNPFF